MVVNEVSLFSLFYRILLNNVLYSLASCFLSKFVFPIPLQCSKPRFIGSYVIMAIFSLLVCFSPRLEIPKWRSPTIYLALMRTCGDRENLASLMTFLKLFLEWNCCFSTAHPSHCNGNEEGGWRLLMRMLRICLSTIFLFPVPISGWCDENRD